MLALMTKASVSDITELSDQAIDWIVLLNSGNATEHDRRQAELWINRSPSHRKAYAEAEALLRDMSGIAAAGQPSVPEAIVGKTSVHRRKYGLAMLAAAVALAVILPYSPLTDRWFSDYYTAVGEQKTVTLEDGSRVTLNTDTALSVDFSATGRRLTLKRGEAVFKVAADRNRPFEVVTNVAVVKALGTVFDILETPGATRILVEEHAVSVKGRHAGDYPPDARVQAGQQAVYDPAHGLMPATPFDLSQNTAWQRGKLVFKNRPLVEVITELDRYVPGRIVITDSKLADLRVSGVFPINDPQAALTMISQILHVAMTRITPWLTLLHS